ncbi:hypothetical protein B7P43_G13247 [Cryptotermes secundus]|uniref:Uncharacterized protein n=1 Tax=Cryptotermes secundus TaxID=105785 RepID=A0A2J7R0S4_9NEOP|nr:hypothetical protein B7P43_G13247 [Cryptotermes secundus]
MTDEVWFHVSGHVNAQNVRIWKDENTHAIQQVPLHSEKVGVWCAVNQWPLFFNETMNSDRYVNDILNMFFNQLTYGYFQQDSATAHTATATMVAIREVFEDRIISRGLDSQISVFAIFIFSGNMKGKFYKNNPRSTEALQNDIRRHYFTSLDTHDFFGTGESGYLRRNLRIYFL